MSLKGLGKGETKRVTNKIITDILIASRKAFVTIAYTTQAFHQVDRRIRDITDFICLPQVSFDGQVTTMQVFKGSRPTLASKMPDIRYYNEPMFAIYNTYERIQDLNQEGRSKKVLQDIRENPAWIKYLMEKNGKKQIVESIIEKESKKMLKAITEGKKTE